MFHKILANLHFIFSLIFFFIRIEANRMHTEWNDFNMTKIWKTEKETYIISLKSRLPYLNNPFDIVALWVVPRIHCDLFRWTRAALTTIALNISLKLHRNLKFYNNYLECQRIVGVYTTNEHSRLIYWVLSFWCRLWIATRLSVKYFSPSIYVAQLNVNYVI